MRARRLSPYLIVGEKAVLWIINGHFDKYLIIENQLRLLRIANKEISYSEFKFFEVRINRSALMTHKLQQYPVHLIAYKFFLAGSTMIISNDRNQRKIESLLARRSIQ